MLYQQYYSVKVGQTSLKQIPTYL